MLPDTVHERLKSVDPDRYRAALFAEPERRERLFLLYAFHAELAKVPELVSEPMAGRIRYQWWRDVVEEIYTDKIVRAHEITTPLAALLRKVEMPRFWVDTLIDGRERDLDPRPFTDLEDAQAYCRKTSGTLIKMAAYCLAPDKAQNEDMIAKAGDVWGLTGLARAWSYYHESMLSQLDFDTLCALIKQSLAELRGHSVSVEVMPSITYVSLVSGYLRRLTAARHNPATMTVHYASLRKQLRLVAMIAHGRI